MQGMLRDGRVVKESFRVDIREVGPVKHNSESYIIVVGNDHGKERRELVNEACPSTSQEEGSMPDSVGPTQTLLAP